MSALRAGRIGDPSSGMRSPCCVCSSGAQAEAVSYRLSASAAHIGVWPEQILDSEGVAPSEAAVHLAVVSEAMLRLASLLRTDHLLGGSESSNFLEELSQAIEEANKELRRNEG